MRVIIFRVYSGSALCPFMKEYTQRKSFPRKYSRMIDNISRSRSWIVLLSGNTKTRITASNSWAIHPFILIPYLLHNYDVSLYGPKIFSDERSLAYWEIEISIAIYSRRGIIKAKPARACDSHRLLTTQY